MSAQIGLIGGYRNLRAAEWNDYLAGRTGGEVFPAANFYAGVDYRFRLKTKRIEFTPELGWQRLEVSNPQGKVKSDLYSFQFNVNIYPFDLEGDCDCPTFSKQGDLFSKGFFFQFAPAFMMMKNEETMSGEQLGADTEGFGVIAGAGLDIGLTKLITVTPLVRFYYYPDVDWEGEDLVTASPQADLTQFFGGLKWSFRFRE